MRRNFPCKKQGLALAVMLASAGTSFQTLAQDEGVEEIVVTGSFLEARLKMPSPVTVIDRDSIQEQGASQIWDLIRNLEVNQGSDTSVAGSNDASQLQGTASVNLRNLGGNSTLTLINGKRFTPAAVVSSSGQEFVDLNTIPLVMTERVEVLTDGGSALWLRRRSGCCQRYYAHRFRRPGVVRRHPGHRESGGIRADIQRHLGHQLQQWRYSPCPLC